MHWKISTTIALGLLLALSLVGVAQADDSIDGNYLDGIQSSQGELSFTFKLQKDGEDSPFYARYMDPFEGDSFFLDELEYRSWPWEGTMFSLDSSHSWSPSWRGSLEWRRLSDWMIQIAHNEYDHYDIPDVVKAGRDDTDVAFTWGGLKDTRLDVGYTYHGKRSALVPGGQMYTFWDSEDFDAGLNFDVLCWDTDFSYRQRVFDSNLYNGRDVKHTTWMLNSKKQVTDSTFLRAHASYTFSDVDEAQDLKDFQIGASGRTINALSINRMNVDYGINWEKRSDGPSRLHPAGGIFSFDIGAKYRATNRLNLNGSFDYTRANRAFPDRTAIMEFFAHPEIMSPVNGTIMQSMVETGRCKVGGRYEFTDEFDASANLTFLRRHGLDNTNFVEAGSPYLWWNSENDQVYILRYRPQHGWLLGSSDWQLKYAKNDRSNKLRNSSADDEHLTIDWTGMLNDNTSIFLGGGLLRTSSSNPELDFWRQKGQEYGGGFSWDFRENWNLNGNYWNYNVSGSDGYDQKTYGIGIGYEPKGNWEIELSYDKIDGNFDILQPLDYNVERVLLNLGYEW